MLSNNLLKQLAVFGVLSCSYHVDAVGIMKSKRRGEEKEQVVRLVEKGAGRGEQPAEVLADVGEEVAHSSDDVPKNKNIGGRSVLPPLPFRPLPLPRVSSLPANLDKFRDIEQQVVLGS